MTAEKSAAPRPASEAAWSTARLASAPGRSTPDAAAIAPMSRRSLSARSTANATGAVSGSTNAARL